MSVLQALGQIHQGVVSLGGCLRRRQIDIEDGGELHDESSDPSRKLVPLSQVELLAGLDGTVDIVPQLFRFTIDPIS